MATPIGKGHRSLNVTLRQKLQLYANVRPSKSIPAVKTRYDNVDLVVVRENTEGMYTGQEFALPEGVTVGIKLVTQKASTRIARYAFDYAVKNNRKKVTCVHKANIQKVTDGLFLETCRQVAKEYPQIQFDEKIIDACCMMLVQDPTKFDVLVMQNLYGDIVSDLTSGLIGGLGLTGSGNFGENGALFEAVHGTAPDIAGKDLANPSALLFSGVMMLRHMGMESEAVNVERAIHRALADPKAITGDLGGKAKCSEFTRAVVANLD
jgi:isocitrate dehydrogenase (NAD+)